LLYAVPRDIREKRIAEVLDLVGLTKRKDDQVKKYSGGMRRRLEIARGLLHKPKVIFLDGGQDSMILTTHSMEEADLLCV
jgi:ABC-2 type transport system ATP-binding protein